MYWPQGDCSAFDRTTVPQCQKIVDDLATIEDFTVEAIVNQLEQRYATGQIYTYIGDMLVALNPFAFLNIYTNNEANLYRNKVKADHPPHIFAVADSAYHGRLHQQHTQCIVISGESGSGKTVTANLLLKQLVNLGKAQNRNLEEKILLTEPIMEAFGNAKTVINDNSSRFGKYLDVTFNGSGMVTGARLSVYMLEQSRVINQAAGEKNFHVFYYIYCGIEAANKLETFYLDANRSERRYVNLSSLTMDQRQIQVNKYDALKRAFEQLGFTAKEWLAVQCIIAAILNLGDLEFVHNDSSFHTERCSVANQSHIFKTANLLQVSPEAIATALTCTSVVTKGEIIIRYNSVTEASNTRDAMAKGLYGRLFDWLVNQINQHLMGETPDYENLSIGLLDIFGFENFPHNSFEQLCINIANEQLQNYFNQRIFACEQQEYLAQGVNVEIIQFSDNQGIIDMFLGRPVGMLAFLDEESRFPKASDRTLTEKFRTYLKSDFYIGAKSNLLVFGVQHYAGRVNYDATDFLEKNRNFLPPEIIQLLRQSGNDLIRYLFQCPLTKMGNLFGPNSNASPQTSPNIFDLGKTMATKETASQNRSQQTVATSFRYSLKDLFQKLISGTPHFVRCIKPNDSRTPRQFHRSKVIQQMQYTGILETVRIRKMGFSHRLTFAELLRRYWILAFHYDERVVADRDHCHKLLTRLNLDGWVLGKSKVFLKYYHAEYLAKLYDNHMKKIITVQSCIRRFLAKIRVWKMKRAKRARQWQVPDEIKEIDAVLSFASMTKDKAAVIIQKIFRRHQVRIKHGFELECRFRGNPLLQAKYGTPILPICDSTCKEREMRDEENIKREQVGNQPVAAKSITFAEPKSLLTERIDPKPSAPTRPLAKVEPSRPVEHETLVPDPERTSSRASMVKSLVAAYDRDTSIPIMSGRPANVAAPGKNVPEKQGFLKFASHQTIPVAPVARNGPINQTQLQEVIDSLVDRSMETATDQHVGPYNFRSMLRCTPFAPTDTLRKMKSINGM